MRLFELFKRNSYKIANRTQTCTQRANNFKIL